MRYRLLLPYALLVLFTIATGCLIKYLGNQGQEIPSTSMIFPLSSSECEKYIKGIQPITEKWSTEYIPSLAISSVGNVSDDVIISRLCCQWLQHFKSTQVDEEDRLDDYVIHRVEFLGFNELAREQGVLSTAWLIYSVKPHKLLYSPWAAGNGVLKNGWISRKSVIVGLYTENKFYKLKLIGGP